MNKKTLPVIIGVVLLLLVGGWYFYTKGGLLTQKKTVSNSDTPNNDQQVESSTNLKDLLTKGVSQTCTYSSDGGSGKIYVAGGVMRGDFETKVDTKMMKSHVIVKDNTSYVWTDDSKTGFKMAFDPNSVDTSVKNDTPTQNQAADLSANYDYKCSVWIKDASQFAPPTDVTFSSFEIPTTSGQTAPGASGAAGSDNSSQCSYCNALSGDDKTQCLTALKCN